MKIISPLPRKRGRLEIIPLIDIMFFLLAAFMVVSIDKIKIDSLKINLPTNVPSQNHEKKEDFISVSMDSEGQVQVGKDRMSTKEQLDQTLASLYAADHEQKILISGDRDARNGDMMLLLAKIRQAGFQHVAFAIKREAAPVGAGDIAPAVQGATPAAPEASPAPTPAAPEPSAAPAAPAATPAPAPTAPEPAAAPSVPAVPAPSVPSVPAPALPAAPAAPAPAAAPSPTAPAAQ